ncbi:MAG TPA: glycosyltransferase family 2 protein [Balneolaceae bacterium]|nr:glycosyltransferase family 2 protein [Balneolaceae bacterium]
MKIHSICLVKDEADIVGDVVKDAYRWSDYIYIFDNGSTDGTTEVLKDFAGQHKNIIFYKWSDEPFKETLRGELYHAFKQNAQKGDWWCRLDADEFYIDNPQSFLRQIDNRYNAVSHSSYTYYFTDKDLEDYKENPDSFTYRDLNYYKNDFSELRFVKDNGHLYWPPSSSWPKINMKIYPAKIRVRHYQYRNPGQITKRAENRNLAYENFDPYKKRNIGFLDKTAILDAEGRLVSHKFLEYDNGDDKLVARENLPEWKPDDHLLKRIKISVKNILFRLNILDKLYNLLGKKQ